MKLQRIDLHGVTPTQDSTHVDPFAVCETTGLRCVLHAVPIGPERHEMIVVVHMTGDIDLSSQHGLEVALHGGLAAAPRHLVLDLSAVRFCGARALAMLGAAPRRALGDTACAVSGLTPLTERLARNLWDAWAPIRYPTLADALADLQDVDSVA